MAAAAVTTSPDPFTFHCPVVSPLAAPAPVDAADVGEFEFHVVPAALSAADELFSGGKLVPLHPPAPASAPCSPPPACLDDEAEAEPASEPTSPRAPRCAGRRWRDLLLLVSSSSRRKPKSAAITGGGDGGGNNCAAADGYLQAHFRPLLSRDSSSSSSASSVDSGHNAARRPPPPSCSPLRTRSAPVASLLHLMSRTTRSASTGGDKSGRPAAADAAALRPPMRQDPGPAAGAQHPLLLTRASSSSSSSASSSSDSCRNPRAGALVGPWRPRGPGPFPSRPSSSRPAAAAESPRVSASGRVVFRGGGLERCSSTPASASAAGGGGARRPRPRGMERSYSANVRVDPVINVFGGFGHLFMLPSSPAKEKKAAAFAAADKERDARRNRPEKLLAMVLRDPQD